MFPVQSVHQSYPWPAPSLTPYLSGRGHVDIWGLQVVITIVYLSIFSLHLDLPLLGIVAFLPFPSHRFPKCHLSLLFVFTLVISLGLPSKVPRKRSNCGHGISEVAVKFGKLVILCRKKYSLGLFPIIYGFLFWFGFLFLFCFGLIFV